MKKLVALFSVVMFLSLNVSAFENGGGKKKKNKKKEVVAACCSKEGSDKKECSKEASVTDTKAEGKSCSTAKTDDASAKAEGKSCCSKDAKKS